MSPTTDGIVSGEAGPHLRRTLVVQLSSERKYTWVVSAQAPLAVPGSAVACENGPPMKTAESLVAVTWSRGPLSGNGPPG